MITRGGGGIFSGLRGTCGEPAPEMAAGERALREGQGSACLVSKRPDCSISSLVRGRLAPPAKLATGDGAPGEGMRLEAPEAAGGTFTMILDAGGNAAGTGEGEAMRGFVARGLANASP